MRTLQFEIYTVQQDILAVASGGHHLSGSSKARIHKTHFKPSSCFKADNAQTRTASRFTNPTFMGSSGCSPRSSVDGYCTPAMFHQIRLSVSSKVKLEMSTARTTSAFVLLMTEYTNIEQVKDVLISSCENLKPL